MNRIVMCCLVLLVVLLPPSHVFSDTGEVVLFSEGDLYYFNKKGKKVPLKLAPKILVRFHDDDKGKKENKAIVDRFLLNSVLSLKTKALPSGEGVFEITFLPSVDNVMLLSFIHRIVKDPGATPLPVFIVDDREAIIRGIAVEPKLTVDPSFVESEITRLFDGVTVRQIKRDSGEFSVTFSGSFFLEGSKMSLTQLLLANIIHKSAEAWISNVRPKFVFLDDPVVVSIRVSPLTGTISQERTAQLTVVNYDTSTVQIDEKLFPIFGEGRFTPLIVQEGGTRVPPDDMFFKVLGKKPKRTEEAGAQSKTITYEWRFLLFVPEKEWEIESQKIMYRVGDFRREAESRSVSFVSIPHLKTDIKIEDISPAPPLPKPGIPVAVPTKADLPMFWFDRFVPDPYRAGFFGVLFGSLLVVAPLLFLALPTVIRWLRSDTTQQPVSLEEEVESLAFNADFYNKLENAFAKHLRVVRSSLPRRFSLDAVKEASREETAVGRLLRENLLSELTELSILLQRRFAPEDDAYTEEKLAGCKEKALAVARLFDYKIRPHINENSNQDGEEDCRVSRKYA